MKPPLLRPLAGCVALCTLGLAALAWWWQGGAPTAPEPASAPSGASAPAGAALAEALPGSAPPAANRAAASATAATAAQAPGPRPDPSRMQRAIQLAVSSQQPGKAREALQYLHDCWFVAEEGNLRREALDDERHAMSEAAYLTAVARLEDERQACQAIDASSHAQWVPLLRRSMAEGDIGAATRLSLALGLDKAVAEPEIAAGLVRDAWGCNGMALAGLRGVARRHPRLLSPHVVGAVYELERLQLSTSPNMDPALRTRLLAGLKQPANADPAEVARLVAEMQRRCPD